MSGCAGLTWQQAALLPWPVKALLLTLFVLVALGLGWAWRIEPLTETYRMARLNAQALQAREAERRVALGRAQAVEAAIGQAEQALQDASWRLSAGAGFDELQEQLSRQASEYDLVFERIEARDQQDADGYRSMPLQLQVVGRYASLRLWLDDWLGQLRLLQVEDLHLAQLAPYPGAVRLQLQVRAYQGEIARSPAPSSLAHEPSRAAPAAPGVDPFQHATATAGPQGLEEVPLERLEMVGVLARRGVHQAVLRLDGRLHRVAVGERLGHGEGRVIGIDARRVQVSAPAFVAGQGWVQRSRFIVLGKGTTKENQDGQAQVAGMDAGAVGAAALERGGRAG
ncbi:pilus assembly protein PilP [Pseudomonas sp. Marseille-QA0332]